MNPTRSDSLLVPVTVKYGISKHCIHCIFTTQIDRHTIDEADFRALRHVLHAGYSCLQLSQLADAVVVARPEVDGVLFPIERYVGTVCCCLR
jgi:hypothetical protein